MQQSNSLFGGLSVKAEPAKPVNSGFSFLSKPTPPPPTSPAAAASAFSFLSAVPAPAAPAATSAFGFLSPSPPPAAAPALKPTPPVVEPRKRRIMAKRPGHARELGELVTNEHIPAPPPPPAVVEPPAVVAPQADPFPAVAAEPQSPQNASSLSVLAGLTVHVPEYEEPPQQQQQQQQQQSEPVEAPMKPQSCVAEMESILARQSELTQQHAQLIALQCELAAMLQSLDSQQEQATLQEDFDLAQSLQVSIDDTKLQLVQAADDIVAVQRDLQEVNLQREDVFTKQHFELEMLADKLLAQSRSTQAKLTLYQQQTKQEQEQSWAQLETSQVALEKQVELADTEQQSALEELALVEERKAVLTADLRKERDELSDAQIVLEDEVAALEQQLQAKLAELDAVVAQTNAVEDKIAMHEAKYASRAQEVEARVAACQHETSKLGQAKLALDEKRQALTAHCEQERMQCESMQADAELAKQQAAELAQLNQVSIEFQHQRKLWRSLPKPHTGATTTPKEVRVVELDREIKEIELNLQQDTKLVQNTSVMEELETQKQLAIQLRNFKEAGRLAAELKLAVQRRTEALQRMDVAKSLAEQKNAERAVLVRELDQANAERDAKRREEEREKLVVLQRTRSEFLRMLDEVSSSQFADGLVKMLQSELASVEAMILLCGGSLTEKEEEVKQVEVKDDPMSVEELENMLSEAIADDDFDAAEEISGRIENKREFLKLQAGKEDQAVKGEEEVPVQEEEAVQDEEDAAAVPKEEAAAAVPKEEATAAVPKEEATAAVKEEEAPVQEEEAPVQEEEAPVQEEEAAAHDAPVQEEEAAAHDAPVQEEEAAAHDAPVQEEEAAAHDAPVQEEEDVPVAAPVQEEEEDAVPAAVKEEDNTQMQPAFVDDVEDDDTPFVDGDVVVAYPPRNDSLDDYKVE